MSGHPKFYELLKEMKETHDRKNHDYAGDDPLSNLRTFGFYGVVVRISDKFHRLKNFAKQDKLKVKDESIRDTLIDMANYALLAIILYDEEKQGNTRKSS